MALRTGVRAALAVGGLALSGLAFGGCGLTLDYSPPDPVRGDGGRFDGGGLDAGRRDSGSDAATDADAGPGPCRTEGDCADGNRCNGVELCVDGVCMPGEPVRCSNDDVCIGIATCQPATGECVRSAPLDCPPDGNPCNGIERCDPVIGCTHTRPPTCDDGVDCTIDACDPVQGCVHSGDNTLCTASAGGTCTADGCVYPTCDATTCVADNPCVTAMCVSGHCTRTRIACAGGMECCAGECVVAGCSDMNQCTEDVCDMATGCTHAPLAGACDDGNACTVGDQCAGTICMSGTPRVCPSLDACNVGHCDPMGCGTVPTTGNPCSDGNMCTTGDMCVSGTCAPGTTPAACDDMQPCTADTCDPSRGCVNMPLPDGSACGNAGAPGMCMGGRCRTTCPLGHADCNGDGTCECVGTCVPGGAGALVCLVADCTTSGCGVGEACCAIGRNAGTCQPATCLACCM